MPKQPDPPIAFWARAREIEKGLPNEEALLVVSKAEWRSGTCEGQFAEVDRFRAAQLIAKETHRLATKAEARDHYEEVKRKQEERRLADAKKDKPFLMYVPQGSVPFGATPVEVAPAAPAAQHGRAGQQKPEPQS